MSGYGLRIAGAAQGTTNTDVLPGNQQAGVKEEVGKRRLHLVDEIILAVGQVDVGDLAQCQARIRMQLGTHINAKPIRCTLCRGHIGNQSGCPISVLRQNAHAVRVYGLPVVCKGARHLNDRVRGQVGDGFKSH